MDMDYSKALQGFDNIWRRVQQNKAPAPAQPSAPPLPQRSKTTGKARRFKPGPY